MNIFRCTSIVDKNAQAEAGQIAVESNPEKVDAQEPQPAASDSGT